jgi:nucleoside-diphosphate-sugar epimerase
MQDFTNVLSLCDNYEVSYDKIHKLGFHHKIEVKEGIQEMLKVFPFLSLKDNIRYSNI